MLVITVGTALWAVGLVATLVLHDRLSEHGNGDWVWIMAAGLFLGLVGIRHVRRRRTALRAGQTDPTRADEHRTCPDGLVDLRDATGAVVVRSDHYSTAEDAMPMTHRHRFARIAGPALVLATAGLLSLPALAPAQAATAPTAVQILRSIGQQPHAKVTRVHAEGPAVVVTDGFCTALRSAGCQLAEHTKDATLVRFDTAKNAKLYAGNADDQATAMGRVVVSFGSPARMGSARQQSTRTLSPPSASSHPNRKNALVRMSHYLTFHHLPMRTRSSSRTSTGPGSPRRSRAPRTWRPRSRST